ncbi:MAG TPA: shikimate dehydrogenase [Thermomicrobiales bacterium]|nr:shikimate dehydrogenase [Thermomicrobiales bacterium]
MTQRGRFRLGVIGDPVEHSISPAMQQPALDALGIPATYERWHTLLDQLPSRIESLRASDVIGANVTVPHKEHVLPLVDEISDLARRAGAVNTISNRDGRLLGDNTDVQGLARSLRLHDDGLNGCHAVVLGAGGAARAVALALENVGASRISVLNRSLERAERLRDDLAPTPVVAIATGTPAAIDALQTAHLVINATALGWKRGEMPLASDQVALLRPEALMVDITYRDTDLLEAARSRGLRTLDGLEMLVFQGARSLKIWTGVEPPVQIMMTAALTARAARA